MKKIITTLILVIMVTGCGIEYRDDPQCKKYDYLTFDEFRNSVKIQPAKDIDNAGKIYVYRDTLLVSEPNKGINIIDNSDKKNPKPKAFIKIYGNIDMAVKDGYLYADSFMDMLVFDIRDLDNIQEVNRTIDVFPYDAYQMIGESDINFEDCHFDLGKGVVVGVKYEN